MEQATWDPYGRPERAGSSQTDIKKKGSTLGFRGAITDKVTGNLVLGPRQYDTSTARFITADVFVGSELDMGLELIHSPATDTCLLRQTQLPTTMMRTDQLGSPIGLGSPKDQGIAGWVKS